MNLTEKSPFFCYEVVEMCCELGLGEAHAQKLLETIELMLTESKAGDASRFISPFLPLFI